MMIGVVGARYRLGLPSTAVPARYYGTFGITFTRIFENVNPQTPPTIRPISTTSDRSQNQGVDFGRAGRFW
jgi:hypothetical protein